MATEETTQHTSEEVQNKILKIRFKADLEKVIFEYGEQGITCLDTIKVLADLQKEMVDIIESEDGEEEKS